MKKVMVIKCLGRLFVLLFVRILPFDFKFYFKKHDLNINLSLIFSKNMKNNVKKILFGVGKPSWAAFFALLLTCIVLSEVYCNPVDSGDRISLSELDGLQMPIDRDFLNSKVKRQAENCDTGDDGDCEEDDEKGDRGCPESDEYDDDDDCNNKPDIVDPADNPTLTSCVYCINK